MAAFRLALESRELTNGGHVGFKTGGNRLSKWVPDKALENPQREQVIKIKQLIAPNPGGCGIPGHLLPRGAAVTALTF